MSEPLYCRVCGAEEGCEHGWDADGEYCEIDGVIHTADDPCPFGVREDNE